MKGIIVLLFVLTAAMPLSAQKLLTPFEVSGGKRSATYAECIAFYRKLAAMPTSGIVMDSVGTGDAGYPIHTVRFNEGKRAVYMHNLTVLINNGIHPGEPDGIDASMMLARDIAEGRFRLPAYINLIIIPVYNIGGALNRNNSTRVNQVGPESYGFRGNAQNLDLNRDFTKADSKEARAFAQIFHTYSPDIFIDNHVSDGADYQHVMTMMSAQYDKLGGATGKYFRETLDPMMYRKMAAAGFPMVPYVNSEDKPEKGWTAFMDPPRFGSGYASLWNTIAWVPETHMLKPFDRRVAATGAFMKAVLSIEGDKVYALVDARRTGGQEMLQQTIFPLSWKPTEQATMWPFKGYLSAYKKSDVTGQQRLYYDRSKPVNVDIPIRDHFVPDKTVKAPAAYILPQGWTRVADRLRENNVAMQPLLRDTTITVTAYTIDSFKTSPNPYESHYKHSATEVTPKTVQLKFLKGDYLISTRQPARRFLVEMLEPEGEDSYFAWNYFDAVLQRKEGYSDYRWEDVAAQELRDHPEIKAGLEAEKKRDPAFAKNAEAQLFYVYRHSRWYEAAHMRYPVYRVE